MGPRQRLAGQLCQRRGQVGQLHQAVGYQTLPEAARPGDDQRHPHRPLVEAAALGGQAMIAEHLAMIGHEDHHGVVALAGARKRLQHPPHLLVDQLDHAVVGRLLPPLPVSRRPGVLLEKRAEQPSHFPTGARIYCLNMFGDAVRDLLDPRLRGR